MYRTWAKVNDNVLSDFKKCPCMKRKHVDVNKGKRNQVK